jgi:hypothetical protein
MEVFDSAGVRHRGLYTFGHSPKHVMLYQRYGFVPGYLTPILSKPVSAAAGAGDAGGDGWVTFSETADQPAAMDACVELAFAVYDGLDPSGEIDAVHRQGLGDTVLVHDGDRLGAFAVCHVGPGTEAGSGSCYVKLAAARPGGGAEHRFDRLLGACEAFAAGRGAATVVAGVNSGRRGAYAAILRRGFRPAQIGVAMHSPDEPAYHHPGAWVIDDWR